MQSVREHVKKRVNACRVDVWPLAVGHRIHKGVTSKVRVSMREKKGIDMNIRKERVLWLLAAGDGLLDGLNHPFAYTFDAADRHGAGADGLVSLGRARGATHFVVFPVWVQPNHLVERMSLPAYRARWLFARELESGAVQTVDMTTQSGHWFRGIVEDVETDAATKGGHGGRKERKERRKRNRRS